MVHVLEALTGTTPFEAKSNKQERASPDLLEEAVECGIALGSVGHLSARPELVPVLVHLELLRLSKRVCPPPLSWEGRRRGQTRKLSGISMSLLPAVRRRCGDLEGAISH